MTMPTMPILGADSVERVLARTSADLTSRFAGVFSAETIDRYVRESYQALYRTAQVKTFVPVLAGRFAADRLLALAQAQGVTVKTVPEVLFICVHNAGRSQIAAALLHQAAAGRVHVRSAGSNPTDQINPDVLTAMAEVGLDLGQEFPKPLTDDVVQAADVVITMGCGDACPVYPGKTYLDWAIPDPDGQPLQEVRDIRDQIQGRVDQLLAAIAPPT